MLYRIYLFILVCFIGANSFAQNIQQTAFVQSLGGGVVQTANYLHEAIVGAISTGTIAPHPNYEGSSIGFLSTTQNLAPIANAGADQIVVENTIVNLNGAASSDPEGSSLTYTWTSLDGITLNNNNVVSPNFTAPAQLAQIKYRFKLQVSDGVNLSSPDTVVVSVRDVAWQPVIYTNSSYLICRPQFNGVDCVVPDVVGAFSPTGECRGLAQVQMIGGIPYGIFNVQLASIEQISFKVYDYSQNQVCDVPGTFTFTPQVNTGTPSNPLLLNAQCISLVTNAITGNLCTGAGINIPYTATGTFNSGNVFTAQLSNASGSFASPITIGSINSTVSSTISGQIPANTAAGTGYRIRVIASSPSFIGQHNGTNLTISSPPTLSANPSSVDMCTGGSVTIIASGANTYSWSPATGLNTTNGASVIANPSSSITYIVTGETNGCTSNIPVPITVSPTPNVSIAGPNTVCLGSSLTLIANLSGGAGSCSPQWSSSTNGITWSNISGAVGNSYTNPNVTANIYYRVTYSCTGSGCNSVTATTLINVVSIQPILATTTPSICTSGTASLSITGGNPNTTYTWQVSTNSGSTWNNISGYIGTTFTTYSDVPTQSSMYQVIVNDPVCGIQTTTSVSVNVVPDPIVSVTASNNNFCAGTNGTTLNATITSGTGTYTYQWQLYNNGTWANIAGATNPSYTTPILNAGSSYQVIVTPSGIGCNVGGTNSITITVNPTPAITVSPASTNICASGSAQLSVIGADTYVWSPTNGLNTITGATVIATPTTSTTYTVIGTDVNGCKDTVSTNVIINPNATINISGPSSVCSGNNFTLNANMVGGIGICNIQWQNSLDSVNWNPIAGATGTAYTGNINNNTYFRATYSCNGSGCNVALSNSILLNVIQFQPTLSVNNPSICKGGTAVLTITGGNVATTYTWQRSTNNGTSWSNITGYINTAATIYSQNPTVNTLYRVSISDPTCGIQTSNTDSVNVVLDPVVTVTTSNNNFCSGGNTTLMATLSGGVGTGIYQWQRYIGTTWTSITGATTSSYTTPNLSANTNFRVISSQTGSGCISTGTSSISITVKALPNVYTNPATPTFCTGGSVTITAYNGATYSWSPATGLNTSTGSPVIASPTSSSTYTLTGIGTNGCSKTISVPVTVNQDPSLTISAPSSVCSGSGVTLTASTGGGAGTCTVQWQKSNNGTSWTNISGGTGTLYTTAGISTNTYFRATYTCNGGGCSPAAVSSSVYVTAVNVQPTLTTITPSICSGGTVDLNVSGGNLNTTYTWKTSSDGGVTWGNIPGYIGTSATSCSHSPSGNRVYQVVFNDPICGVLTTPSLNLTVVADPVVTVATSNNNFCAGGNTTLTTTFTGGLGTNSYQWQQYISNVWTNISGATGATYTSPALSATTNYRANLTQSVSGCSAFVISAITVNPLPNITTSPTTPTYCVGGTVSIAAAGGSNYSWSPVTGLSTATGSPVVASGTISVTYSLTGTGTNGCTKTISVPVTVKADPTITITGPTSVPTGTGANLDATVNGGSGTCTLQWQSSTNGTTWTTISGATTTTYTTPAITGTKYYRATYTCTGSGCSPAATSNVLAIIGVQPPVRLSEKVYNLTLYPNPASVNLTVSLSTTTDEKANFIITDVLGKTLTQWEGKPENGVYENEVSIENLPQGVYFLSVKIGERIMTQKFVKE